MNVTVTFPEELVVALREEPQIFSRQAMIYTLGHLYAQGRISAGLGAQVLGCDRRLFYALLSEYGFAVIDYPAEDLTAETRASRLVAERAAAS
jgi:predicted HTH domain antitoxin